MATTYDKASLVMIPSGYKDDKLYSVKPTDGSGDFTFSRDGAGASPATRVNASGLIEKGYTNELLQSNTFSTTWTRQATSLTSGQTGYDGSSDAWLFNADSTGVFRYLLQSTNTNAVITNSMYAKAGTTDFIAVVDARGSSNCIVWFDLGNGAVGSVLNNNGDYIDSSIESVGGGWYKCSATFKAATSGSALWFVANGDGSNSADAGDNVYIQDAMQNEGLVAQDYIETTTAPVSAGLLGDMPRLDYSGGASCGSLLLEPSRVNVVSQSEYFGGWIKTTNGTGVTPVVVQNDDISPEGVRNASKLTFDVGGGTTSSDWSLITLNVSGLTSGANYVSSVYLKGENGGEEVLVRSVGGSYKKHTLTTEWERYDFLETSAGTSYTADIGIRKSVGHTINSSATIYAYGFVSELGSYPTSYIPTYGSASTRGADSCVKTGISSLIGQTEGTLYWDFDAENTGGYSSGFFTTGVDDGSYNNAVGLVSNSPADTELRGIYRVGGSTGYLGSSFNVTSQRNKIAIVWTASNIKMFKNGVLETTLSKGSFTASMGNFYFPTTGRFGHYNANQIISFTTALTDSEAIALTTI